MVSENPNETNCSRFALLRGSVILFAIFANSLVLAQDATNEQKDVGSNEYKPCIVGPQMLRATDEWERKNRKKASVIMNGKSMASETAAEMFISDCSQQLAVVSGMAASEEGTAFRIIRNTWSENLEFMKWWLQNRQQKSESPMLKR